MKTAMMMFFAFVLMLGGPALAQDCTPFAAEHLVSPGKLQMSINPTQPPQQYVDEKGELQGLNVELANAIAEKLCLEPVYFRMNFEAMVPGIKTGRFDEMNTGLFWTEERAAAFFLVPYSEQGYSAVASRDSSLKLSKPEDMSGLRVGAEASTQAFENAGALSKELQANGRKPITVQGFGNISEARAALQVGQIDLMLTPDSTAADIEKRGGGKVALARLWPADRTFAFRDKALAQATADALVELKKEGVYDKIFDKFGMVGFSTTTFGIRGPGPAAN